MNPQKPPSTPLFITFEGIDGSGKSTQLTQCGQWLQAQGYQVVVTRNPGGTALGSEIRQMLLHHEGPVSSTCELLLYMADRAQHVEEVIRPGLDAGNIILCDRYTDSTLAYQGYGRGLDIEFIQLLNQKATQGLMPHLTFLFDAPPEVLATRVAKRGKEDRLEREALSFREKVRAGYLDLAKQEPTRFSVLDATGSIEDLHTAVLNQLKRTLENAF